MRLRGLIDLLGHSQFTTLMLRERGQQRSSMLRWVGMEPLAPVTRWLAQARERHSFDSWVTFHAWRKTTATVLDEAGATARMIADQLGHSRVSMTQDGYLGRRSREPRVVAALELADPVRTASIRGAIRGLSVVDRGASD